MRKRRKKTNKNVRNYQTFKTGKGIKICFNIAPKILRELDALVNEGYYVTRTDAIRDALNFFVYAEPFKKRIHAKSKLHKVLT